MWRAGLQSGNSPRACGPRCPMERRSPDRHWETKLLPVATRWPALHRAARESGAPYPPGPHRENWRRTPVRQFTEGLRAAVPYGAPLSRAALGNQAAPSRNLMACAPSCRSGERRSIHRSGGRRSIVPLWRAALHTPVWRPALHRAALESGAPYTGLEAGAPSCRTPTGRTGGERRSIHRSGQPRWAKNVNPALMKPSRSPPMTRSTLPTWWFVRWSLTIR